MTYKCPRCGAAIRYMAAGFNRQRICDDERIEIVTSSGHTINGYKVHDCRGGISAEDDKEDSKKKG